MLYVVCSGGDDDDGSWDVLKSHWSMALRVYHNSLKSIMTSSNSSISIDKIPPAFDFDDLLCHATVLSRKPMRMQLQLSELGGRMPLKKTLNSVHIWLLRILNSSLEMNISKGFLRTDEEISDYIESNTKRLVQEHIERLMILQLLSDSVYTSSIDIFLDAQSGSDITISVEHASTAMPISVLSVCPLNPFCPSIRPLIQFLMREYAPTPTEQIHATLQGNDIIVKVICNYYCY